MHCPQNKIKTFLLKVLEPLNNKIILLLFKKCYLIKKYKLLKPDISKTCFVFIL